MMFRRHFLGGAAAALAAPLHAVGKPSPFSWPSQPVRLVVTFPPGGASDIVARLLAPALQQRLGQPVVIDNRPGAGSSIGAAAVASARNDGHTLLLSNSAAMSVSPFLLERPVYDPVKDFTHLFYIGTVPTVFVVHPSVPATNLAELVAWIKQQPGPVAFGSGGAASVAHIVGELFARQAGVRLNHIAYRGAGPMRNDLLGGQIKFAVDALPQNLPFRLSGQLRLLAVTTANRVAQAPDLATVVEARYPSLVAENFVGISAPAHLPQDISQRLYQQLEAIAQQDELKSRLQAQGFVLGRKSPVEFSSYIRQQAESWAPVVKATGASLS